MTCSRIDLGNGVTGWACSRGARTKRCKECGRRASKLCDYPLRGPKADKTCDANLCDRCAVNVGPDRDYCQTHARLSKQQELRGGQFDEHYLGGKR